MLKRVAFFILIISILNFGISYSQELIKVRLFSLHRINSLEITDSEASEIFSLVSKNEILKMLPEEKYLLVKSKEHLNVLNSSKKSLARLDFPVCISFSRPIKIGFKNNFRNCLRGKLILKEHRNNLLIIAYLPLEDYIKGVVAAELGDKGKFLEVLKAQAVVARSFTLANLGRHKKQGYDFCDSTHCQLYKTGQVEYLIDLAAEETKREVLKYKGNILSTFYHSTCGGRTAATQDVFGKALPGFSSIKDTDSSGNFFCKYSPHFEWKVILSSQELRRALNKYPLYATGRVLKDIKILLYTPSQRAKILLIKGERNIKISAYKFYLIIGNSLGWGKVKSTYFKVSRLGNKFVFTGYGLGHGIGLCQYGAKEMGRKGYSYRQILKHYFPKADLGYH